MSATQYLTEQGIKRTDPIADIIDTVLEYLTRDMSDDRQERLIDALELQADTIAFRWAD